MTIKQAALNFKAMYYDNNLVNVREDGKEIIVCVLKKKPDFYPTKFRGYKVKYTKPVWTQKS